MRQIILLETQKASDGITRIRGVFWFPINPLNSRVPKPQYLSAAAALVTPNNITAIEQTSLEDGSVREELFNVEFPASNTATLTKNDLVRRYNDRKIAVDLEPPTRAYYGVSYDGSNWSG